MQTLHAFLAAVTRLAVALALIAAPWANPASAASLAAPSATATVNVGNGGLNFSPTPQTIAVGDTVHWVWDGSFHSTTSGSCAGSICTPDGKWDSGVNNVGFTYDRIFTQTGTFNYYCSIHGPSFGMRATIQVIGPITGLTATNNSPTLLGSATDFTATLGADNVVTYTWDFGDGQGDAGALASHVYSNTGFYTAVVTASNPISTVVATTPVTIALNLPIAGLSAENSSPTVLGNTTDFTATISAGTNVTYTWSFGDGQGDAGALTTHLYSASGFYTAVVTASNPISTVVATTPVSITRNLYLPLILR